MFTRKMFSRKASRKASRRSRVHPTPTARSGRYRERNARQQSRRNGTKVRVRTFVGGFFNKFITDLKNLTK